MPFVRCDHRIVSTCPSRELLNITLTPQYMAQSAALHPRLLHRGLLQRCRVRPVAAAGDSAVLVVDEQPGARAACPVAAAAWLANEREEEGRRRGESKRGEEQRSSSSSRSSRSSRRRRRHRRRSGSRRSEEGAGGAGRGAGRERGEVRRKKCSVAANLRLVRHGLDSELLHHRKAETQLRDAKGMERQREVKERQ